MRRDLMAATACAVVLGVGGVAGAAPSRVLFRVEPKAYSEALLDLAQQANVTLIGAAACSGTSRGVSGLLTVEEALDQVLAGAPCTARVVAAGTVEVQAAARAEAARLSPPVTVSELLVTATRRVRDPRQLAVAVTAIPRGQLLATGSADAGEAAGQLAGVLATNLGPGRNKLLLRGLSDGAYTGRARSIVATYLDDLPVNYNAPDPDLRLVDVDRVEIARGPQGALYGAGSLSGVYRIVTRKPDLTGLSAEVRTTGALTQDGDPSYAVEGYANYPLRLFGQTIGLRLSAYQEEQGGYLDNIRLARNNADRTERRGARLIMSYAPTDDWSFNLTLAGQHLRSNDTHYTTPGLKLKRDVRIPEPHVNDIELATATIRRSWGWGELTSSTGAVRHRYGSLFDATSSQRLYTQFAQTSAYAERTRTTMLVEDLVLTSRGAGPVEWLAGLYGSYTRTHSPTEFLAQVPRADLILVYGDDRRDRIQELAAYSEVSYAFGDGWTVALGGRAFTIQTRTRSAVVSESSPPRSFDREKEFSGVSPKLSVQKTFGDGNLAYAVISEGYRSGGLNSGGATALPVEREAFSADRLINYEVGLKLAMLERRLGVNAATFYSLWDDIQTDQFRPSGIPYTTNAGDAQVMGIETEVAYRTDFGLLAQLNGRLTRTRTGRPNPASLIAGRLADGLPGSPPVSAGAVLSYERDIADDVMLRLVGQATYVGRSRVSFEAAEPRTRAYGRVKLSAELLKGPYSAQVFVVNPLNSYSDTFAFGNPFNLERSRQVTPQRPRTIGVTISAAL
ncbi:MAG: TonB-dependent receptor [Phenylobacterium sp.]|uniref:TonB-dependent receptor n=1 Tax=Phenylobacterium sp. TaxID=1871053 RepID=UPI001A4C8436|nr:TonB-dependent receptor [Phenylobacterium sp.]MBL8553619.1 TonB-dependent receptor [Phenylobacterium sp.]